MPQQENGFPLITIVISNYNSRALIGECLSSLMNLTYPNYEIIVVDAASTDGSARFIEEEFPKVNLIKAEKMGIGKAINLGIKASKGELVVVDFNSDEIASPEWLSKLYSVLKNSPNAGAVGGIRIKYGSNHIVDSAGGRMYFFGHQSKIGEGEDYGKYPKNPREVDYLGCILVYSSIISKVGLLDEDYFIYGEDADYCLRIRKAGYRILCVPEAVTYHKVSLSLGEETLRQRYFLRRAETRVVMKNGSPPEILLSLLWAVFLISTDALMLLPMFRVLVSKTRFSYLCNKKPFEYLRVSVKALMWNLKNMSQTFEKRNMTILSVR
jgi:GT2 family glycosyltransferase